jgi:WWE domain
MHLLTLFKDDKEEEEEEEEEVKWFWAGDAKTKKGPIQWVEYSDAISVKLELALKQKKSKVKIDDERFVDLSDRDEMMQCRYEWGHLCVLCVCAFRFVHFVLCFVRFVRFCAWEDKKRKEKMCVVNKR